MSSSGRALRQVYKHVSMQWPKSNIGRIYTRSLIHDDPLYMRSSRFIQAYRPLVRLYSNEPIKSNDKSKTTSDLTVKTPPSETPKKKLTLMEKIKHEAQHYWDGTKLLGYEIKVSVHLAAKMAAGYDLTRREMRQLRRTVQDISRLIPFSVFVIVPFAELLLPVALKIFPNLLPSTYESSQDKEKKSKVLRKTRDNVSDFLRETVSESGMLAGLPDIVKPEQRKKFATFFRQVRSSGEKPSQELLVSVSQMFKDDIVLDNLSRPQLIALSKYLNLQPYGTNVMLRYSIRYKLKKVKRDDLAIDYEGVESLSIPELQSACSSRGIKTYSVSPARLRKDLTNWLELRLHEKVPSTLLLLSSAYTYNQGEANSTASYYEGLLAVLSGLPEELYHEAELELASNDATNKQRLEVVKEQEELIKDENEQEDESGHVIKVQDNLNIDEESTPAVAPPESENVSPQDSTEYEPTPEDMVKRKEPFEGDPGSPARLEREQQGIRFPEAPQDSTEYEPNEQEMEKRREAMEDVRPQDSTEYEPTHTELEKRDEAMKDIRPQDSTEYEPTPEELEKRRQAMEDIRPQDSTEYEPTPKELDKRREELQDVEPQDSTEYEPTSEDMKKREKAFKKSSQTVHANEKLAPAFVSTSAIDPQKEKFASPVTKP